MKLFIICLKSNILGTPCRCLHWLFGCLVTWLYWFAICRSYLMWLFAVGIYHSYLPREFAVGSQKQPRICSFIYKETLAQLLSSEFCEISRNTSGRLLLGFFCVCKQTFFIFEQFYFLCKQNFFNWKKTFFDMWANLFLSIRIVLLSVFLFVIAVATMGHRTVQFHENFSWIEN